MSDVKRIKFILEKIEDIESFINKFNSIVSLLDDKMGFDAVDAPPTLTSSNDLKQMTKRQENFYKK